MGLLSFLGFGESDDPDAIDDASVERLESLSEQAVEAVLVPEESIPIEEDAWTLAPSPARARVGASGLEPVVVESKPTPDAASIEEVVEADEEVAEAAEAVAGEVVEAAEEVAGEVIVAAG